MDNNIRRKKILIHALYKINCILLPPAKVMFIIWTICAPYYLVEDDVNTLGQKIFIILFGYLFYCGFADLVYVKRFHDNYTAYKAKIYNKKELRLFNLDPESYRNEHESDYGVLSIPAIQRKYNLNFDRASEIMNQLQVLGFVRTANGNNPRTLLCEENSVWEYLECNVPDCRIVQETQTPNYDHMEGHQFEYFCADVLKNNGFINVEVTQGSGDHGIDILAEKDSITYAIQCKCYSANIGNAAVQQAHTGKSLYHKDIAVVLTNRYFTTQARQEAQALGVKLWDRDKLDEMISNQ